MRPKSVLPALLAAAFAGLPAQGVVNPSILRAPEVATPDVGPAATVTAARAAVVHVRVEVDGPRGTFALERPSSGVVVDDSGLVLTWSHLVAEVVGATDKRLLVQLDDAANTRLQASIVRQDDATGLALLRVTPPAGGLTALPLGADRPRAGEGVVVLARPEGKEMVAFLGVASPALAPTRHRGVTFAAGDFFLTDSRNDERCDGAPVIGDEAQLLGIYGAGNVRRDEREPTLEDLRRPSYGIVVPAGVVRRTFAAELAAALRRAPAPAPSALAAAVAAVAPSVVSVWAGAGDWPDLGLGDPGAAQRRAGLGSGVVLSAAGLVVTNRHVVDGGTPRVRGLDGKVRPAKVVASHVSSNLALLQVELPAGAKLVPATCAPDEDPILGEAVLAVGNPMGGAPVVSGGVVSAIRGRNGSRVQADANLGAPNGGGAIVDVTGRLIGIADGGAIDPIELAFRQRGDRATTESNLSTYIALRAVRSAFGDALAAAADAAESIRAPAAGTAADVERRRSPLTAMIERSAGAMLNIYIAVNVAKASPEDELFGAKPEPQLVTVSLGSGVVIDSSGLALSNWHVVDDATFPDGAMRDNMAVTASVFGGKSYRCKVLSISRENDLSLLQLELAPGETVQAVELGSSDRLRIGDAVAAIGNPHGKANTITYGVTSKKGHFMKVKGRWAKLGPMIETDAAINGGNSGGALVDMQGRLVGINSAGGGTFNNVGYAIEVDHVREVLLGLLLSEKKLRSPWLGCDVLDDDGKVLVMKVDERGPAAQADLRSGDRVVSLAGTAITWGPGYAMTLRAQRAGEELEMVVERDGARRTLAMTPLAPAVAWLLQQSDLRCRAFDFREDPERVRAAWTALFRQRTGSPTAEPPVMPEKVVLVEKVFRLPTAPPSELEDGDLLLGFEFVDGRNGNPVHIDLASVEQVRDIFGDMHTGKTPGVDHYKVPAEYACWIARGAELKKVTVRAVRLLW